ncbi:MAG: hypothetical protein EXQ77_04600 [Thermoleophilia bacterium]|nr:hypothetical protein [Thermoleophilia bacterium]
MSGLALSLDALGDTRGLWDDWLAQAAGVLGIDVAALPADRGAAAVALDAAGAGNWRVLLARYAADRAPVYLRPAAEASAALRRLAAAGTRVVVFTDAPVELAELALAHLGAARRVRGLECGEGARERALTVAGPGAHVVAARAELVAS